MKWNVLAVVAVAAAAAGCNGNDQQQTGSCASVLAGDLVITELLTDPPGTDTGKEYVEVYNTTGAALELKGLTLYTSKLDGTSYKSHFIRTGTVSPKGYFTLGDVRSGDTAPAYIDYAYGADLGAFGNTEGVVGLKCSTTVVDEVRYDTATAAGHSRCLDGQLAPDATLNDDAAHWCDASAELEAGLFGSPRAANPACPAVVTPGTCQEDGGATRAVVSPQAGELVVTELLADPAASADTDGEWIEVLARADVDLNGVVLTNGGTGHATLGSSGCLRLTAGSYAVLGRDTDAGANGGLPPLAGLFTFGLGNTSGTVTLGGPDGGLIDTVSWTGSTSGVASQLRPDKLDAVSNDDSANFCPATVSYGAGDKGTPGAVNSTCPQVVGPNQCIDPGTSQVRAQVGPNVGELVVTEYMADPKSVDDAVGEWVEVLVKADVDLNGLELLNEGSTPAALTSNICLRQSAGTYVLFARSADTTQNGGLPDRVLGTFGFSLGNSGARALVLRRSTVELDRVAYDAGAVAGVSMQLSADKLDVGQNDLAGSWCALRDGGTFGADGGDRGTPAAPNQLCP